MVDQLILASSQAPETIIHLAQAVPGSGGTMEAPPGLGPVFDRIIGGAKYIGIFITIIAVIAAFAGAAISRQRGNSEEATERFLTISLAIAGIVGAVTLVSWILDAAMSG
ncbi:hypothetical protein CXF35_00695 [Corynebacterium bovis]|uniref:Uncharacterized protein n=1 Tax=Corynebacterium bovis TaxID=36808 RepID=A0A426Q3Z6_9CORY|nr:hypothetical protein [Corynebacterium bovis]QQC48641.1 hypothetical protein I6I09_11000 [Corynebacterium bovis]RRO92661.1 hypothetical protein CXF40_03010 [Corynebacterium bovis]RRO99662.1 hypothetical protein CXF41_08880 [Corynebacterium bovis]RRQ03528.1 hypothetical protein CXF42_06910 [Corynebacterium bovis]RRQ04917.1 hypothetical protein CXF39_00770 [Corynebacterium bovis]